MSDPRGFRYGMQALLNRSRWRLEALQCALADALRRQQEGADVLQALRLEYRAVCRAAAPGGTRFDPLQACATVEYLAGLAGRMRQQERQCEVLAQACGARRRECADAHARLEAVEAHRGRALAAHRQVLWRRESALADEQWMVNATKEGSPMAGDST